MSHPLGMPSCPPSTDTCTQGPAKYECEALGGAPCTNTALRRATRRLGYLYDEALASVDLRATQVGVMYEIDQMTGPQSALGPTLQELASRLAIQISALTHALRPLLRDGLVALSPDAKDKRSKRGVLTPEGKLRLKTAMCAWSSVNARVEEVLGCEAAGQLRALADQVASDAFLQAYEGRSGATP